MPAVTSSMPAVTSSDPSSVCSYAMNQRVPRGVVKHGVY